MKESSSVLSHPRASLAPYATRKESRQYELSQEDEQLFNDDNDELESTDFDKVFEEVVLTWRTDPITNTGSRLTKAR
jgi:hypothetical protein